MSQKFENGLFIFRRDLRIIDNIGLYSLQKICKNIYTIFIFTPEQVSSSNSYKSLNAVQFMIESLQDLANNISKEGGKLMCFYGDNNKIIHACINVLKIDVVCFNLDITPYARERDNKIAKLCNQMKIHIIGAYDYYLFHPGSVMNGTGNAYQKFTPYYHACVKRKVDQPLHKKQLSFGKSDLHIANKITLEQAFRKFVGKENSNILVNGGRENAVKQILIAGKNIKNYSRTRDELSKPTSQLGAYIKFGCVSVREIYKIFKSKHEFIRQLIWREFYATVLYFYPHVIGHAMKPKYDKIKWHHNDRLFNAWKKGTTGIPILDAAQRQLLQTGWVHNRGRMISSNILAKIFMIDWRKGEKFYAQYLVDYDVANNNGGWQWSSGTGADSQEYWRTFNPFTQAKEYDPECVYIKTWVPELREIDNEIILNWDVEWEKNKNIKYLKPIVDYKTQKELAVTMYKDALY